jgi:two-component system, sensor histidine kinase and response regulator
MEMETILIVEDDHKNIQAISVLLEENNYDLGYTTTGEKALIWLEKKHCDLILMDVGLPGMNGLEACQRIRRQEKYIDLPILFLTGKAEPQDIINGFESGGQDYITKPFNANELIARCKTHLELRRRRKELERVNIFLLQEIERQTEKIEESKQKFIEEHWSAKDLDEIKTDFLKIISHEVNTPLHQIVGFNYLLKEIGPVNEKQTEYLFRIDQSVKRLEYFSDRALEISKVRALKKFEIEREEIEIYDTINCVINEQSDSIKDRNLNISSGYNQSLHIFANPKYFKIVISEIIRNAIFFNNQNGTIDIIVSDKNNEVSITIEDNGCGFSDKALDRIFSPLSPGVPHYDQRNIGLGLFFCQAIMEVHDGSIRVGNKKGDGAYVITQWPCG